MYWEVITITDNTHATLYKAFSGTTGAVSSYKMGYTDTGAAASSSTAIQTVSASGSSAISTLKISGGWDLSTQTQTGKTIFRQMHGTFANRYGYGLYLSSKSYVELSGTLGFLRYSSGIYYNSSSNNIISGTATCNSNGNSGIYYYYSSNNTISGTATCNSNGSYGIYNSSSSNNTISGTATCNSNGSYGIYYSSNNNIISGTATCNSNGNSGIYYYYSNNNIISGTATCNSNGNYGIYNSSSSNNTISGTATCNSNGSYGIYNSSSSNNTISGSLMTTGNGTAGIRQEYGSVNYINNSSIGEATEVLTRADYSNSRLYSTKHDQTLHNDWIFTEDATINKQNTTTQAGSGYAWKTAITSSKRASNYPVKLSIAKIACAASSQVTVTAYVKKDHATNVAARIICRGGQIGGVASDVTATKASDTNWEQLTLQFTPNEVGVVEIELESWYVAGNSNVYVDTVAITQA